MVMCLILLREPFETATMTMKNSITIAVWGLSAALARPCLLFRRIWRGREVCLRLQIENSLVLCP